MRRNTMRFIYDMVHHNPGEAPFHSMFQDPKVLAHYGYNGKVIKNMNVAITFEKFDPDIMPQGSPEREWVNNQRRQLRKEICAAKAEGLEVFTHIDMFVLPKKLVEKYKDQLCDEYGRIALDAPLTLKVHEAMYREFFEVFPEVDGLIIRVGETYLFDAPYHVGNGPIRFVQYETSTVPEEVEIARYIKTINFLRHEICEVHDRYLFFRTWDCYPDKFHANLDYYLAVTDAIEPHEKLFFNIKHTALDFWRRVQDNPCLGRGKHKQVVEVQCQREYEGKGAHPNYVMHGVIDGFPELKNPIGLNKICEKSDLICGVFTWTRGGGWYGPYLPNELWCQLHSWVMAHWAEDPSRSEEALFLEFWTQEQGMSQQDAATMRKLCLIASEALLKGHYCGPYDRTLHEKILPSNMWMRDDRLGGLEQLKPMTDYLNASVLWDEAMQEKDESVELWNQVVELSCTVTTGNPQTLEFIRTSSLYGRELYTIVRHLWNIVALYQKNAVTQEAFDEYDAAWERFRALQMLPQCPTLYVEKYLNLPGQPEVPGIGADFAKMRQALKK